MVNKNLFFKEIDKKKEQDNGRYYAATKTQRPLAPIDFASSQRKNVNKNFVKSTTNGMIPAASEVVANR